MAEREVILDEPTLFDDQAEAVRQAMDRAERAEAELAKMKAQAAHPAQGSAAAAHTAAPHAAAASRPVADAVPAHSAEALKQPPSPSTEGDEAAVAHAGGEEELRKDSMMAHLLDSLEAGKDIGHYGRLVFAMVARHFMPHEEVLAWMMKDKDDSEEKATVLLRQVEGKDYSPPKRDKILQYQAQQDFPIIPNVDDPDCGNLYRNLKFPNAIYSHISHYQEAKQDSGS